MGIDFVRAVKLKTFPASTHDEINNKNASRAKNIVFQEAPEEHNPASYPSDPESKSWVHISYAGQFATIKSRKKKTKFVVYSKESITNKLPDETTLPLKKLRRNASHLHNFWPKNPEAGPIFPPPETFSRCKLLD